MIIDCNRPERKMALWRRRGTRGVALAIGIAAVAVSLTAQTPVRVRPSTATGEWPTYSGDLAGTKYSPLDQITAENFGRLQIAWRAKSPDASISVTMPGGGEWYTDTRAMFD